MLVNPKDLSKESLEINSNLKLFQIYKNLKHVSLKCDTYFQVYEEIFNRYVGKKITFVEIGVLHGDHCLCGGSILVKVLELLELT